MLVTFRACYLSIMLSITLTLLLSVGSLSQSVPLDITVGQVETKSVLGEYNLYPLDIRADVLRSLLQNALPDIARIPESQLSPLYQYNESGWSWKISAVSSTGLDIGGLYRITEKALAHAP